MKSGVLGNISLPAHAGPPTAGQGKDRRQKMPSVQSPAAILRQGEQRPRMLLHIRDLNSWVIQFEHIPATVASIAEQKSAGSRDEVGFLSEFSREKVGAPPIPPAIQG